MQLVDQRGGDNRSNHNAGEHHCDDGRGDYTALLFKYIHRLWSHPPVAQLYLNSSLSQRANG